MRNTTEDIAPAGGFAVDDNFMTSLGKEAGQPLQYVSMYARSPLVGTESNAFAKSKYATSIWSPSSIALVQLSMTSISWRAHERPLRNPYWWSAEKTFQHLAYDRCQTNRPVVSWIRTATLLEDWGDVSILPVSW